MAIYDLYNINSNDWRNWEEQYADNASQAIAAVKHLIKKGKGWSIEGRTALTKDWYTLASSNDCGEVTFYGEKGTPKSFGTLINAYREIWG